MDGKVAIITGGAAAMGESHVRLFIEVGWQQVVAETENGSNVNISSIKIKQWLV
ncbi:hypothetical protein [Jeotgalibaca sp. PTS2502]|uniref:hypothetical protein n=1 Tax=Jeotgalibaca sp. PTS2502 TaxID=1903686 RepID=UPI0018DEB299|nr:hypothetical protein [Jeotgalibaca sp. PTS2502]